MGVIFMKNFICLQTGAAHIGPFLASGWLGCQIAKSRPIWKILILNKINRINFKSYLSLKKIYIIKCIYWYNEILHHMNTVLPLIRVNSNTIELTVHTSFYCVLDLLCVTNFSGYDQILQKIWLIIQLQIQRSVE